MYTHSSSLLLRWLKVPPEPQPPFGAPDSLRIFRAGKNYFKLRLLTWAFGQTLALAGVIFWAFFLLHVEQKAGAEKIARAARAEAAAANPAPAAVPPAAVNAPKAENPPATQKSVRKKRERPRGWDGFVMGFVEVALRLPPWAFPVIWALKLIGFLIYLLQIPLTYSIMRLDFEMRWYVVTDRSLRIRNGVWSVQELTMSFANLQQVVVTQGPLQRLLKIADVRVQSAGGGGAEDHGKPGSHGDSLHTGLFHGVDNPDEIRDLILARLKRFRETGLGDPDEKSNTAGSHDHTFPATPAPDSSMVASSEAIAAARELAAEARALRTLIS